MAIEELGRKKETEKAKNELGGKKGKKEKKEEEEEEEKKRMCLSRIDTLVRTHINLGTYIHTYMHTYALT